MLSVLTCDAHHFIYSQFVSVQVQVSLVFLQHFLHFHPTPVLRSRTFCPVSPPQSSLRHCEPRACRPAVCTSRSRRHYSPDSPPRSCSSTPGISCVRNADTSLCANDWGPVDVQTCASFFPYRRRRACPPLNQAPTFLCLREVVRWLICGLFGSRTTKDGVKARIGG